VSNFKISHLGIFLNKQKIVQELKTHLMSKVQTAKPGLHRKVHFMNNQKSRFISFGPLFEVKNILFV
jgi:hypothetical protein